MGSSVSSRRSGGIIEYAIDYHEKKIFLKSQKLHRIPSVIINKVYWLEYIDLSDNFLKTVPSSVGTLTALKVLLLNDNSIEELPDSILSLSNLEVLNLRNNRIHQLPIIRNHPLASLKELDISANPLLQVPNLAQLLALEDLKATFLTLSLWPREELNISKLRCLDLADNEISVIPDSIADIANLEVLIMRNNAISKLPVGFIHLTRLTNLDLSECPLDPDEILAFPFDALQSLATINLSFCDLPDVPESIYMLKNLEHLSLNNNRIQEISPQIGNLRKTIKYLDLSANVISTLPGEISLLESSATIKLFQNPLESSLAQISNIPELLLEFLKSRCGAYGPSCILEEIPAHIEVRQLASFKVRCFDIKKRPRLNGGDKIVVSPSVDNFCNFSIKDMKDGTYIVHFSATKAGSFLVDIFCNERKIKGTPLAMEICGPSGGPPAETTPENDANQDETSPPTSIEEGQMATSVGDEQSHKTFP